MFWRTASESSLIKIPPWFPNGLYDLPGWKAGSSVSIPVISSIIIIIIISALVARISLTLSCHSSLSFIALGRSSGQHPVSSHSCWMYVRAGRVLPFARRMCGGPIRVHLLWVRPCFSSSVLYVCTFYDYIIDSFAVSGVHFFIWLNWIKLNSVFSFYFLLFTIIHRFFTQDLAWGKVVIKCFYACIFFAACFGWYFLLGLIEFFSGDEQFRKVHFFFVFRVVYQSIFLSFPGLSLLMAQW